MTTAEPDKLIRLADCAPFEIGRITVRPSTREIECDSRQELLEPRVMQVLVALIEARGAVVSRDALVARCWTGRVVGDNAIHRVISKLRAVGRQFADGAFEIETIAKVGYRLRLSQQTPAATKANPETPHTPSATVSPTEPRFPRRLAIALTGSAVIAAGALGAVFATRAGGVRGRVETLLAESEVALNSSLPDGAAKGVGLLEEAVSLAPEDARAWGLLALARADAAENASPEETALFVARSIEAARRALALDARQPDALSAQALLPPYYGDWFAAETRMNSVLAVAPAHLPTLDALSFLHVGAGLARQGARDRVGFSASQPVSAHYLYRLTYAHWILGDVGAADRVADRAMQLWPGNIAVWFARLWTLAFTGRASRALAIVKESSSRPELPPPMIEALAASMEALESPADAARRTKAIDGLLSLLSHGPSHSINAILLLNGLGEIDSAFEVAEAYLLERGPLPAVVRWRKGDVSVDDQRRRKTNMLFVPVSAPMRKDPRFERLVEDIGLAEYWRMAKAVPDFRLDRA